MGSVFFSIVIPTYNSALWVKETVLSALNQTFSDYEVVVDDNHSTDGTLETLQSISSPHLKLFANQEDLNIPKGWTRALKKAKGQYKLLLHSDNLLHPQYLETIYKVIQQYAPKVLYTDCLYFEGHTPKNIFSFKVSSLPPLNILAPGSLAVSYIFRFQRMVPTSCLMVDNQAIESVGYFNPQYEWDPDMALLTHLAYQFGATHILSPLAAIRTHKNQAPNWRSSTFSPQYKKLLLLQHKIGKTEPFHYRIHWTDSNYDIVKRLAKLKEVPLLKFLQYWIRWLKTELSLIGFFLLNFLRRIKASLALLWLYLKTKIKKEEKRKILIRPRKEEILKA